MIEGVEKVEGQALDGAAEQQRGALAAGQDAGDHGHAVALHVLEQHGRPDAGGGRDRSARADEAVDAGEFGEGVDRLRVETSCPGMQARNSRAVRRSTMLAAVRTEEGERVADGFMARLYGNANRQAAREPSPWGRPLNPVGPGEPGACP